MGSCAATRWQVRHLWRLMALQLIKCRLAHRSKKILRCSLILRYVYTLRHPLRRCHWLHPVQGSAQTSSIWASGSDTALKASAKSPVVVRLSSIDKHTTSQSPGRNDPMRLVELTQNSSMDSLAVSIHGFSMFR
jgi:hypothetical protein